MSTRKVTGPVGAAVLRAVAGSFCVLSGLSPLAVHSQTGVDWPSLSAVEARKGYSVDMRGIVLCCDREWNQLYFYDGSTAIYLDPRKVTNRFEAGQYIEIHARTTWGGDSVGPTLTNMTATVAGRRPLPRAASVKLSDVPRLRGKWIEISGAVRSVDVSRNRITLLLKEGENRCLVYVLNTTDADPFRQFADCHVTVRGIDISDTDDRVATPALVSCPGVDQVTIVSRPRNNRWDAAVTSVEGLLTKPLGEWTNQPIHLNGLVSACQPGRAIAIKDPTGVVWANVTQMDTVELSRRVDLWGFLTFASNGPCLGDAYFEASAHPISSKALATKTVHPSTDRPTLTSIHQVRVLSKDEANENIPASVRGVLTYADPAWRVFFLQDDHDATFIDTAQPDLRAGQFVEVSGFSDGTGFAPELIRCTARVLGVTNFPAPIAANLQDAANGHLDARWIELQGVVHNAAWQNERVYLTVFSEGGAFSATVLDFPANEPPETLIDSLVAVRGACSSIVNSRGQITGVNLNVPSRGQINVLDPGHADPFASGAISIAQVATFDPKRLTGRRVKIAGVVTAFTPAGGLFVQDESGAIRVAGQQTNVFQIGERVEALGFPGFRDLAPCIEEAAVRREGSGPLPNARPVTAARVLQDGICDAMRVKLTATILQNRTETAQPRLTLQDGSIVFNAQFVSAQSLKSAPRLDPGSIVQIQGVCEVQWTENHEPGAFRVLASNPSDVVLIRAAPWWTPRYTLLLLAGIFSVALVASTWVVSLRRRVQAQTDVIRENQKELLEVSRRAGMAEVATSVLHNVGNVLTSVNVAATVVTEKIKGSTVSGLSRGVALLGEHESDLGDFVTRDPRGKHLPAYLKHVAADLRAENESVLAELVVLRKNVEHIKEIVAMQQSLARVSGVVEMIAPQEILEDALLINATSLERHGIRVVRNYAVDAGKILVEKHKALQILVNLISNASHACREGRPPRMEINVQIARDKGRMLLSVLDNGIGIPPENLARIFSFGFTTRKDGHGFGLHGGALAATEMGGQLTVQSEGVGKGARFTLELPCASAN